jgi:DNA mismatch repair protein MutS
MTPRTPMLKQYFAAKAEHPGVLIAMRVGDFYEFYGEDAETAARALEITLTGREDGENGRIPMAGVPYHSVEKYLARLVQQGIKVALCDQLEDPKEAKGLVKRGITRVLTPGTLVEDTMLAAGQNSFLAAICVQDGRLGLAFLEPSTGEFLVTEMLGDEAQGLLLQELARIRPSELLVPPAGHEVGEVAKSALGAAVTQTDSPSADRARRRLLEQLRVSNLAGYGCEDKPSAVIAAGMILAYAEKNQLPLKHIDTLSTYSVEGHMALDVSTRRSLELTQNLTDGSRRFTLLSVLDSTCTAMGARLLRRWVEQPLLDAEVIRARHDAVERLIGQPMPRADIRDALTRVADIERLTSRASTGVANPRDLVALREALRALPVLADPLRKVGVGRIQELREQISDHESLALHLESALVNDPPAMLRDGGVLREGYDPELDKLRDLSRNGKAYIAALEQTEREATGIASLKVGFNSVFGYYLEIPKAQIARAPEHYIRKQTTANAERYITAELKEHETQVLGAQEKAISLESELFQKLRNAVSLESRELLRTARALAEVDVMTSLAEVAVRRDYTRPEIVEDDVLEYRAGRHAVVEASGTGFVPNDAAMGTERCLILTGPNMAGKSTYLRQTALIVLMAQIGSFVPAKSCRLGLCDRIFARIGAKDELAVGQSTFMVEMVEAANILNHASPQSLVILDEVGRGTSTYDGLAIAWAMVEHLASVGSKTLFATHYHQLNALAEQIVGVANYRVAVEEFGHEIVWTHRVLPGGTDRSYGVHVARMAGVPPAVLQRASEVLADLESRSNPPTAAQVRTQKLQLTLFEAEESPVVQELQKLDVNRLTPIEALRLLDEWKRSIG